MTFKYVQGDLFELIDDFDGITYVPHVVNNKGLWKTGFVRAIDKYSMEPYNKYKKLVDGCLTAYSSDRLLGISQYVAINRKICVVNMFAQTFGGERPLRYNNLVKCMEDIVFYYGMNDRIICPKFGSLRAGGDWQFIEKLIEDCWLRNGLDVTVVEYNEQKKDNHLCPKCEKPCEELYSHYLVCRTCYSDNYSSR